MVRVLVRIQYSSTVATNPYWEFQLAVSERVRDAPFVSYEYSTRDRFHHALMRSSASARVRLLVRLLLGFIMR